MQDSGDAKMQGLKDHDDNNVSSRFILFQRLFVLRYPILTSIGSLALR